MFDQIMKLVFSMIIIHLISACGIRPAEPSQKTFGPSDIDTLTYLKQVLWPRAYASHDTALLNQILGNDFQMIDQEGRWYSKQDELTWVAANKTQNDSFYYEIKRLEILENGTAIVCGTGHIWRDGTRSQYQSSNVLQNRNDRWKAVLSHVSGYEIIK